MNFYQTIYKKIYGDFNIWTDVNCDANKIDLQGWGGDHQIFKQINDKFDKHIFVDVGIWKGQSSINLAKNIKQNNLNAVVISIDTFLGSVEHFDYIEGSGQSNYANGLYKRLPGGRPNLYEIFLNNIMSLNLQNIIIPVAQTSTTAALMLKLNQIYPTFIHIDASHEYRDVKRDINDYYEILSTGGTLICDDYNLEWSGVVKAVNEFCFEKTIPIINSNTKVIINK